MKKLSIILAGLLFLSQNISGAVVVQNSTDERGYISASAEKVKEVSPNKAQVSFTKENTAKTVQVASNDNKAAVAKIKAELEKLKASGKKIEISTGSYIVRPNYSYKGEKRNTITDYTVSNSVIVKTSEIDMLGKIIDIVLAAGADRVNSLNFSYESNGNNCNEMIKQATLETLGMAKAAAVAAGSDIKGIKSLHTSCYQGTNNVSVQRNFAAKSLSAGADMMSESYVETSISPQNIKMRANVNAEYYVK